MADDSSHVFVPDDEGLFCLFCGRTASEHRSTHKGLFGAAAATNKSGAVYDEDVDEALEDEASAAAAADARSLRRLRSFLASEASRPPSCAAQSAWSVCGSVNRACPHAHVCLRTPACARLRARPVSVLLLLRRTTSTRSKRSCASSRASVGASARGG